MKNSKCHSTAGLFPTRATADRAIQDLKADGFRDEDIGLIWKDTDGEMNRADGSGMTEKEQGAVTGATVGAVVGATAGATITAGLAAGIIPVIGPVLALGTLGTLLLNAAGGAAVAGLAGTLIGWGVSEDDAKYYEQQVAQGHFLVTVNCGVRAEKANGIYTRHGGVLRTPIHNPALNV